MGSSSSQSCTILACQVEVPLVRTVEEKQDHVATMVHKVSQRLDKQPADLVLLPELSTIEYSRETFDQLKFLSEDLAGPSVDKMRELAVKYQSAIVFGMPRRRDAEHVISQIAIDADGVILGCYDKIHICQYGASMEKEYFARGRNLLVFTVAGIRFAPIICYDIRIPELSRVLTLEHDCDCILHCGAYFRDESFASWHAFATTRAMENQLYLLSLNRAGLDYGHSVFCPPWIDESLPLQRFSAHAEDFRYLTVERATIEQVRKEYTFLQDRLSDYKDLST